MPDVAAADWVSREQALDEFQQLSGLGEALKELPENPLPGVVIVTPEEVDKDKLEALRQQLAELPGVQLAQLDLLWVERLTAILKLGDRFVFGLTLLLVATLLLVIGNTIRLHIENRRTEIEVIKLVGGTDGYVRRPFLYTGAFYGKAMAIESLDERLPFIDRGQQWVIRKLREYLPGCQDPLLRSELQRMLLIHEENSAASHA